MKCETMLARLLDADRDELEGRGASEVAVHVRECARCGAVAARLLADTSVLAAHVATAARAGRSPRREFPRPMLWGGALVAAATFAVWLMPARTARVVGPSNMAAVVAKATVPAPAIREQPLVRYRETRFADAVAATPVRLVASQLTEPPIVMVGDSTGVAVSPRAGRRSAVLATRNEKITVVWLY